MTLARSPLGASPRRLTAHRAPSPSCESIEPDRSVRRGTPRPPERKGNWPLPAGASSGSELQANSPEDALGEPECPRRTTRCRETGKTIDLRAGDIPRQVFGFREKTL